MHAVAPHVFTVDELSVIALPRDGHAKVFGMIDAYIDESGIHGSANVLCVAGYWGSRNPWRKFEQLWHKAIRASGFRLEDFHANQFFNRRKPFDHLSDSRYSEIEDSLLGAIEESRIHPVSANVIVPDFQRCSDVERRFLTGATIDQARRGNGGRPELPYFVPFHLILRAVCADYVPIGSLAHFSWGVDRPVYLHACEVFKAIRTSPENAALSWRERLGEAHNPLARQTPSLQAADLLAYVTWKAAEEAYVSGKISISSEVGMFASQRRRALRGVKKPDDLLVLDWEGLQRLLEPLRSTDHSLRHSSGI